MRMKTNADRPHTQCKRTYLKRILLPAAGAPELCDVRLQVHLAALNEPHCLRAWSQRLEFEQVFAENVDVVVLERSNGAWDRLLFITGAPAQRTSEQSRTEGRRR